MRGARGGAVPRPLWVPQARWTARATMVIRWHRSRRSRSPSTVPSLSVWLVSGARCWGTSYRRRRRASLPGTTSIAHCHLSVRERRSPAWTRRARVRDCSSSAFPRARSSTGFILMCGSAPGSWVRSVSPPSRPSARAWSPSARCVDDQRAVDLYYRPDQNHGDAGYTPYPGDISRHVRTPLTLNLADACAAANSPAHFHPTDRPDDEGLPCSTSPASWCSPTSTPTGRPYRSASISTPPTNSWSGPTARSRWW